LFIKGFFILTPLFWCDYNGFRAKLRFYKTKKAFHL